MPARPPITEFRRRLGEGLDIPEWYTYPEIVQELRLYGEMLAEKPDPEIFART